MSFVGRLAFVTGGGSGIGKAACQLLAKEGASVVVADKVVKNVNETINSIPSSPTQMHLGIDLHVEKSESVGNALLQMLEKYSKPPTIIVNCAGITRDNFLLKLSEEDFEEVIDVNLKGTFLVMKTFGKSIVDHGITNASIINIGSIVGKYGNIGQTNYTASKAGVELLTRTASQELGKMGIRVNTILPGMISTPIVETVPEKVQEKFMSMIPLKRFGRPEEVAEVIAFLASDKSSYITGASITVTGGF
ncbi:estradiol 17-beta-dehydrogenase 8 [Leptinotarsa decemlineata]|uniref:estradiol 17-beta-dehydrogenase 8 n=1 Tax=Leptinotarsa decemlineata TaxID=7539 RepID=UPI003D309F49